MDLSIILLLSAAMIASRVLAVSIAPCCQQRAATCCLYGKQLPDIGYIKSITDSHVSYAERGTLRKPPAKKRRKPASKDVIEQRRTAKRTMGGPRNDERWNEQFRKLQEYKEKHGDTMVPQWYKKDPSLAMWVHTQKREYKKRQIGHPSPLDDDRIKTLNETGFVWNPGETNWAEMYQKLVQYKAEHGDTMVPRNYLLDRGLATWVNNQRARRKLMNEGKSKLTKERFDRLEAIGFVWDPFETKWTEMYQKLVQYKAEHGDTLVSSSCRKEPKLGRWVDNQREQGRKFVNESKSQLTKEHFDCLEAIGFEWNPLETKWTEMYQKLRQYKTEHGDTVVPQRYSKDPKLANWVNHQRAQGRKLMNGGKSWLTREHFDHLEAIGFEWRLRPGRPRK